MVRETDIVSECHRMHGVVGAGCDSGVAETGRHGAM